jgi:peroxiredoxin Q/BCP
MTRNQASDVRPLVRLRIVATSARAAVTGLLNVLIGRGGRDHAQLEPGNPAPDFELPGSDGHIYRLSQFRGHEAVVLAWFPRAFTSGCTAECESLQASQAALRGFRARYFGVNVDTPGTNRQFSRALGLEFPILSDVGGHVARAYGVLGASGYPSRWTFFVATDGRIAAIDKHVRTVSHGRDVAARLADLNL